MSNSALHLSHVSKSFHATHAVVDCSFDIQPGQILSLIGPNGAGKTTLLKMIVGLLAPTKGSIEIHGVDITKEEMLAKNIFGYVSDDPSAYDFLTGREFLIFTGRLRGLSEENLKKKIKDLVNIFPIQEIIDQRMVHYSRGNKQKLAFLASLLSDPKVLIIDEPIVGLDPLSIEIFGKKLTEFAKNGGAILFSTHILTFAKEYATHCALIHKGKIVHIGDMTSKTNLEELYEKYSHTA